MDFGGLYLLGFLTVWLTPLWLIGVGAALGLLVLVALYGLIWLVSRRTAAEIPPMIKEGVLQPILYVAMFMAAFAVVAAPSMPYARLMESVGRLFAARDVQESVELPVGTFELDLGIQFRLTELQLYEFRADQDVQLIADAGEDFGRSRRSIRANQPSRWQKSVGADNPFEGEQVSLLATNDGQQPATLELRVVTGVEYPEVIVIPMTAASLLALCLIYLVIYRAFPQVAAIAATTGRQAITQPLFYVALALGATALLVFIYLPYNTFGEDVKMLKDSGLTLIMVLSIIVAVWTASASVADELEGRTALTVLSKPISRRQFVLGKFLGIIWPIVLMFVLLGLLFLATVSYKVVYDARESASGMPSWQQCYFEMIQIVPGLVLAFLETVTLTSIAVAISTRLSSLANLVICSSIYVLGHLVPLILESAVNRFQIVEFVGRLIAVVIPVLDHFNMQAAIAKGAAVPATYLAWALLYCLLYSTIMMLVALLLFEDRDLA